MSNAPTPTIGRIVLAAMDPKANNGADLAPAIITRVFSHTLVNVRVLGDSAAVPEWRTSVTLYPGPEEFAAAKAGLPLPMRGVFWPARV